MKITLIKANRDRYSLNALCQTLSVSRNAFYYQCKPQKSQKWETMLTQRICQIFHLNYRAYGTRRIKEALKKEGIFTSRKRIARIMMLNGWRSKYTVKKYRPSKGVNEADCKNEIHCDRFNVH